MRKHVARALTVAIIALFFAGAILARVLFVSSLSGMPESVEEKALATDDRPTVMWSVASSADEDAKGYVYSLVTKKTTGPMEGFGGPGAVRFNQSKNLCDQAFATAKLAIECAIDERAVLTMRVTDETENGRDAGTFVVDPRALGVMPSASEGYLLPVAVADDKSAVYLGRRVETESWVAGLWKLDVATGDVSEVAYVREHNLYQYDINPATKQLLGVTFVPPESLGEDVSGPSEMHMVDLSTGSGRIFEAMAKDYLENPMLSEDGARYAFREAGPTLGAGRTIVLPVATGRVGSGWEIDGVMKDWFGDTLVFDRDGNLFLYDLKTETETQLTHETNAVVEYLGAVR